jgi:hypothetical protein
LDDQVESRAPLPTRATKDKGGEMRCKACNRMQTAKDQKLYNDLCRRCYEIAVRPDDDHEDQGLDPVNWDEGWFIDHVKQ